MSTSNHQQLEPVSAHPSQYRTLCDLPVEIVTSIVSHIKEYKRALRACSLTCPCLRATTIDHVLKSITHLRALKLTSLGHLISFLETHPDMCKNIQGLKLSGNMYIGVARRRTPEHDLDASTIARLMQLLPNIKSLEIGGFTYPPLSRLYSPWDSSLVANTFRPAHLDFLSLSLSPSGRHHTSSIPGLFLVLCMISSIGELDARNLAGDVNPSFLLSTKLLQGPLRIEKLRLSGDACPDRGCHCGTELIESFARAVVPGSLQSLEARCSSVLATIAVGELLERVGGGLTSLDVGGAPPPCADDRAKWENPFNSHWRRLNLRSCPHLESIVIHIYHRAPPSGRKPPVAPVLSKAGVSMLSEAPETLRQVTINVYNLPSMETIDDKQVLGLHKFDTAFPERQFPFLEKVHLRVDADDFSSLSSRDWWILTRSAEAALPGVKFRRLLAVHPLGW